MIKTPLVKIIKIRTTSFLIAEVEDALIASGYLLQNCKISTMPFARTGSLPVEYDWDVFISEEVGMKIDLDIERNRVCSFADLKPGERFLDYRGIETMKVICLYEDGGEQVNGRVNAVRINTGQLVDFGQTISVIKLTE